MLSAIAGAPFGRPTHAPARIQMLIAILVPFAGGVPPWSVRGSSSPLGRQSLKTIAAPWSRRIDGPSENYVRIAPELRHNCARIAPELRTSIGSTWTLSFGNVVWPPAPAGRLFR